MAASFDYTKVDLYNILGIQIDATAKDVIKAYRKKALKYHPDKNKDPGAVEIFHQLSKALEVLTDEAARAAYDKILKARAAAQLRHKQLDAKRQKLKEDLEAREQAGVSEKQKNVQQARNLQAEVERLRKEGNKLLEREQALLREELAKEQRLHSAGVDRLNNGDDSIRIKLKWKCSKTDTTNGGYTEDVIKSVFSKYGDVSIILISSKRNGSAILEFNSLSAQADSLERESGLSTCPLMVSWLSEKPLQSKSETPITTFPASPQENEAYKNTVDYSTDADFEDFVLNKLAKAESSKQIVEPLPGELHDNQEIPSG